MKKTIKLLSLIAGMTIVCGNVFGQDYEERIVNGDLEGSDLSSFAYMLNDESLYDCTSQDVVVDEKNASNHCIKIVSVDNAPDPWSTKFYVRLGETLSTGDLIKFTMRARANRPHFVVTQAHTADCRTYVHWEFVGNFSLTTEWQIFSYEGVVTAEQDGAGTIAFLLHYDDSWETDPNSTEFYFDDISFMVSKAHSQCPDNNHPHMIDLGLPSGTKWACCNVGATAPEGYGDYFAWGETQPKDVYDWDTYLYGYYNDDGDFSNLVNIGTDIAGTDYDAATTNWGDSWQMPTADKYEELINNCTSEFTTQNGVKGFIFTGPNGFTIFLPAASQRRDSGLPSVGGEYGYYRSSTLNESYPCLAVSLVFNPWYLDTNNNNSRSDGQPVRPVAAPSPSGIPINETTFPDANFRNWVLSQTYGQDGVLTADEIAGVTEIDVSSKNIANLKGIEYFTELTKLVCVYNQLASLDVSHNTALTDLRSYDNLLTSLDVSQNIALTALDCGFNQLTSLDVSHNTALIYLVCCGNQLTSLDISKNKELFWLECYSNRISESEMGKLVDSMPTVGWGRFIVKDLGDDNDQNVINTIQVATAKAKGWLVNAWDASDICVDYDGTEPTLDPIDTVDFSSDIDGDTDLDGNVVGDIYYNISSGDGGYNVGEGCIVVTTPTDDSVIDGQDIFGEDFQNGFTGIVFKVPAGKGTIKVEAETIGTMVLKVKIGDAEPVTMELEGRLKVSFPYNVSEPTYVYIYGGTTAGAPDMAGHAAANGELKLYGIEVTPEETGIEPTPGLSPRDGKWYTIDGSILQGEPTQKGVYIVNGHKVVIK